MNSSTRYDLESLVGEELSMRFSSSASIPLLILCDEVENYLLEFLKGILINELQRAALEGSTRFLLLSKDRFLFDKFVFEIRITFHAHKPNILQVAIPCIDSRQSRFVRKPLREPINGMGRFSEVRVFTAEKFLTWQENIAEVVRATIESGYKWLYGYIWNALENINQATATALYSELRQSLPSNLVDNIWLYAVTETQGIYIPDNRSRIIILDRVSKRTVVTRQSPLSLAVDFSTRILEYDKLFSKIVFATDQTLESTFVDAPYADCGLEVAEEPIYRAKDLAVQPLVREGSARLVASYPLGLREELEPLLKKKRKDLKAIMERSMESLHKQLLQIEHNSKQSKSTGSIINTARWLELKPNIFGLGFNINQIVEDILQWYWKRSKRRRAT